MSVSQCRGIFALVTSVLAVTGHAATVTMGQIDLIAGQTLTLRLDAAATRQLTSAAMMSSASGRLATAPDVVASLGPIHNGARWLRITARPDAAKEQYQIHGVAGTNLGGVLPIAVRVVPPPRAGATPSRTTIWSIPATTMRTTTLGRTTAYRAVTRRLVEVSRDVVAVNVDLGSFAGGLRAPGPKDVYDPRGISIVTEPNIQVTGISPEITAAPGAELVISGQYLPTQVAVRLAGANLSLLSSSATTIRARLPVQPTSGALVLVRASDGAQAVLEETYTVETPTLPPAFDTFDAYAPGYSWKNAYLLSLLSWLAYADPSLVAGQASTWGLTQPPGGYIDVVTPYFVGQSGSTQALVLYNATAVFVAFQGSTSNDYFQDWADNDVDATPQPANHWGAGVVLHHGFTEAMSIAYDQVLARVQPLLTDDRRLWITGHSLGGAVALLTAFRLRHEDNVTVQGAHVFGAPQVGNAVWGQIFPTKLANVHRWSIEHDPVPLLLPVPPFTHVGTRNNLYGNGSHVLNDPLFFVYVPSAASLDNLTVTHMSYWCRLHEELTEHEPAVAATLPPPPDLDMMLCGG